MMLSQYFTVQPADAMLPVQCSTPFNYYPELYHPAITPTSISNPRLIDKKTTHSGWSSELAWFFRKSAEFLFQQECLRDGRRLEHLDLLQVGNRFNQAFFHRRLRIFMLNADDLIIADGAQHAEYIPHTFRSYPKPTVRNCQARL